MEGFIPHKIGREEQTAFVYSMDAAAGTYKVGELLYLSNGLLTLCSGTNVPQFVSMKDTQLSEAGKLCVTPVRDDIIYETHNQAAFTSIKVGDKVTVHTDGMQVTATTTNGTATVRGFDGTAAGSCVYVVFEGASNV